MAKRVNVVHPLTNTDSTVRDTPNVSPSGKEQPAHPKPTHPATQKATSSGNEQPAHPNPTHPTTMKATPSGKEQPAHPNPTQNTTEKAKSGGKEQPSHLNPTQPATEKATSSGKEQPGQPGQAGNGGVKSAFSVEKQPAPLQQCQTTQPATSAAATGTRPIEDVEDSDAQKEQISCPRATCGCCIATLLVCQTILQCVQCIMDIIPV